MREGQRHRDAFEEYFQLRQQGHTPTEAINSVAIQYGFSERTIWQWKKAFNWDEREAIRAAEIQRGIEEKTNEQIIDNKARYLAKLNKLIFDSDVKIQSVSELIGAIKTASELQGQTERFEGEIKVDYDPKLIRRLGRKLIQERKKRQDNRK